MSQHTKEISGMERGSIPMTFHCLPPPSPLFKGQLAEKADGKSIGQSVPVFTFPLCLCVRAELFWIKGKQAREWVADKRRHLGRIVCEEKRYCTACHHGCWGAIVEWIQTGVCMEAPPTDNIWRTKAEDWLWCTSLCVYYTGMILASVFCVCVCERTNRKLKKRFLWIKVSCSYQVCDL